jgi:hypothetical protein
MPPVAGQSWMGLGFASQQGLWISAGAVRVVAELDAAEIPFGPFLITGTFVALFWGEKIIQWYLSARYPILHRISKKLIFINYKLNKNYLRLIHE